MGYKDPASTQPILLVDVNDKKTGPPFLELGLNLQAQTAGVTDATLDSILVYQDLGGYGSEARAHFDIGYHTGISGDYLYRPVKSSGYFLAPHANLDREPYYIYQDNYRLSQRQSQFAGGGMDVGWGDRKTEEVRLGWEYHDVSWTTTTGFDSLPDFHGGSQRVRVQYVFDNQDRGLVPRYGLRATADLGYLYDVNDQPGYNPGGVTSAPQLKLRGEFAHAFGAAAGEANSSRNVGLINVEGGTEFNRDLPQPFRFTLGGPLRLAASAIDQYRGTDYFLVTPGYLRQLRQLPAPLSSSVYVGGAFEYGQIRRPDGPTLNRGDIYLGIVAETPLGVLSLGPSVGNAGERKFNFTLGKLF